MVDLGALWDFENGCYNGINTREDFLLLMDVVDNALDVENVTSIVTYFPFRLDVYNGSNIVYMLVDNNGF